MKYGLGFDAKKCADIYLDMELPKNCQLITSVFLILYSLARL
jgi:hypothetical protein